jgi:formate/nitrite transporter FocA (FNT family)
MATQVRLTETEHARLPMPRGVRYAVLGIIAGLFMGAVYLIVVRGQALLVDLSGLAQRLFCL